MNDNIDIVVSYVNDTDPLWQADYKKWKQIEIKNGANKSDNRQAFGAERYREWGVFKYWFRGIAKNCPWIHKIFVVVQNEHQVPEWLHIDNPKIQVVYHEDYIPKEILPTFNGMPVNFYLSEIPGLSDNYIFCNDDMFFLSPIAADRFFKDNKPVHVDNKIPYKYHGGSGPAAVFWKTLDNNLKIEADYLPSKEYRFGIYHLPPAHRSDFEREIIAKYKDEFIKGFAVSKFRHEKNYCDALFDDLLKICDKVVYDPHLYKNCAYVSIKSDTDFNKFMNSDIVCFNDTEALDNFEKTKANFIAFLEKKFPEKCEYERD